MAFLAAHHRIVNERTNLNDLDLQATQAARNALETPEERRQSRARLRDQAIILEHEQRLNQRLHRTFLLHLQRCAAQHTPR